MSKSHPHYALVAKSIEYLAQSENEPSLAELSAHVGLSESHFQRVFSQWVGVSPKQYLQHLKVDYAKQQLRNSSVLDTALGLGMSGSSRLHDLLLQCEGMTPGEYKRLGEGLEVRYGYYPSPFGYCFLAATTKGVCRLVFFDSLDQLEQQRKELADEWPRAELIEDQALIESLAQRIFPEQQGDLQQPLKVLLKGSEFQLKVWQALLAIPRGSLCSYQQLAAYLGQPTATRAVASAIARNNIGYLIPCHRVIRSSAEFSQYRWGVTRKKAMIGWEASQ